MIIIMIIDDDWHDVVANDAANDDGEHDNHRSERERFKLKACFQEIRVQCGKQRSIAAADYLTGWLAGLTVWCVCGLGAG